MTSAALMHITGGEGVLCGVILFCLFAIWAAGGRS